MNITCQTCRIRMTMTTIGGDLVEMFQDPPVPYQITSCDIYTCQLCGSRVAHSVSLPHSHHFEDDFKYKLRVIYARGKGYYLIQFEKVTHAKLYNQAPDWLVMGIATQGLGWSGPLPDAGVERDAMLTLTEITDADWLAQICEPDFDPDDALDKHLDDLNGMDDEALHGYEEV